MSHFVDGWCDFNGLHIIGSIVMIITLILFNYQLPIQDPSQLNFEFPKEISVRNVYSLNYPG